MITAEQAKLDADSVCNEESCKYTRSLYRRIAQAKDCGEYQLQFFNEPFFTDQVKNKLELKGFVVTDLTSEFEQLNEKGEIVLDENKNPIMITKSWGKKISWE